MSFHLHAELLRATEINLSFSVSGRMDFPRGCRKREPSKRERKGLREKLGNFAPKARIFFGLQNTYFLSETFAKRYFLSETFGSLFSWRSLFRGRTDGFPPAALTLNERLISVALTLSLSLSHKRSASYNYEDYSLMRMTQ